MTITELQTYIGETGKNASLYEEKNFDKRIEVIDFTGFQVIEQVGELLQKQRQPAELLLLKCHAEKLMSDLEAIDTNLFQRLREYIRSGRYRGEAFKSLVNEYVSLNPVSGERREDTGYDNLDMFINGLFPFRAMPEQTKDLEPEMVYYQKTPARIVFELADKSAFTKEDVFFDLGAGLGQVVLLVNLLTGITAKGIEFEPAFCDYAGYCAAELNLPDVTFINVDARDADYSEGTVFFMYTPFRGEMLEEVLAMLRKESLLRKIKIITYGPCTAHVALQGWLHGDAPVDNEMYRPCVFSSF